MGRLGEFLVHNTIPVTKVLSTGTPAGKGQTPLATGTPLAVGPAELEMIKQPSSLRGKGPPYH